MLEQILKFFSADNKKPTETEKTQKTNVIVIAVGMLAILLLLMFLVGGDDKKKKEDIGEFKIVSEDNAVKTKWIGEVAPKVQVSNQKVREVIEQNKNLRKELDQLRKEIKKIQKENRNNQNINRPQTPQTNNNLYKNFPAPPTNMQGQNPDIKPKELGLTKFGKVPALQKKIIVKTAIIEDPLVYNKIATPQKETKKPAPIKPENMISTGSISKVILLGGMDAPTMARAKSNPLPVLMKVTDTSFLPNDWREDIQGCFFLGEGYGDLSSERAYIRVNTLSCVTKDGYHIDTPLKGAVYGEDGKVGLRGRVVTKQGAMLARTLVAGFLQGISSAFKQSNTIVSVNPDGNTQTIDPKKALQTAAFSGASTATQKLAEFYLKMADQIAPVIEISAGRRVDVIALEPVQLKPIEFMKKGNKK